jgi:superfamily I DNA/RNA helicase/RecB family exonuclease
MTSPGFERLPREATEGSPLPLDATQTLVIALADTASAAVIGAPGSGKTTTLVEVVADRILTRGWAADQVLALTPSRVTATRLRDAIALRLDIPTTGPMARTVNSLAFEIVRDNARRAGRQLDLKFLSGDEEDRTIRDILAGHELDGTGPAWPETLPPEVRALRSFRTELRELMMRATEYGVSANALRALGKRTGHPEWVASADFIEEYLEIAAIGQSDQVNSAELLAYAASAIASGDPGERIAALRLIVVDDLQEVTESTMSILRALAGRGIAVLAFGDPDVAANAFRGGEPDALGRLSSLLALPKLATITLGTVYRQGAALRAFTSAITQRIGAAAAGTQRAAVGAGHDDPMPLARIEASSAARQWAAVARVLRQEHLENRISFSRMAVVVRSGAQISGIGRALALSEVQTRTSVGGSALRDDRAARALLTLVDVAIGRSELTPDVATELLVGPFGGLDRLTLRRLRLALRAEEVAGGGRRPADELLVEALAGPGRFVTIDSRPARVAGALSETLALVRASEASIEELLWLAWDRSGNAKTWYDQALGSGITATEADRNLDGIVALFTSAKRFVERRPDAAPAIFLSDVLDAEVPEDTLSPQASDDAVLVTTPSGTVGLEFDVVIIAGLHDGAWPNLRLRGSMLAPQQLVREVTGIDSSIVDERKQVLSDELRMFALAASRARRRVVLAAVANEDEAPSVFMSLAPEGTPLIDSSKLIPLSLRAQTGWLRRQLTAAGSSVKIRADAASTLAALAIEQVPGADPDQWHGLLPPSSTGPLFEGQSVPISPSSLEKLVDSPLDWFLEKMAGSDSGVIANVGTIIHWAMETAEDSSIEALWSAVEKRWGELLFEAPWLAERQKHIARELTAALSEYLVDFAKAGKVLVGAEKNFTLEIDRAVMRGSIDRVERSADGAVVIVDLKTGTPITSAEGINEHPQLAAYQLAYAEGHLSEALAGYGPHSSGGAKLLFVKAGVGAKLYREGVQTPLDAESLDAFRERVRQASEIIAAAEFAGQRELPIFGRGDVSRLRLHRVKAVSSD